MATDSETATSRPRSWLLAVAAVTGVAFAAMWLWSSGSAVPPVPASNPAQGERRQQPRTDKADLEVQLGALNAPRPAPGDAERNPFRFQPKPPPPPPPSAPHPAPGSIAPAPAMPPPDPGPPPPPPIPLKFIGIVEKAGLKVAAMSDCRSTYYGSAGQIIDGRYRLISIGVESMVIEYVDGRGRTTVRLEGCPAR